MSRRAASVRDRPRQPGRDGRGRLRRTHRARRDALRRRPARSRRGRREPLPRRADPPGSPLPHGRGGPRRRWAGRCAVGGSGARRGAPHEAAGAGGRDDPPRGLRGGTRRVVRRRAPRGPGPRRPAEATGDDVRDRAAPLSGRAPRYAAAACQARPRRPRARTRRRPRRPAARGGVSVEAWERGR